VFASHEKAVTQQMWSSSAMSKQIRPAVNRVGLSNTFAGMHSDTRTLDKKEWRGREDQTRVIETRGRQSNAGHVRVRAHASEIGKHRGKVIQVDCSHLFARI
jgi:hypothetical protein